MDLSHFLKRFISCTFSIIDCFTFNLEPIVLKNNFTNHEKKTLIEDWNDIHGIAAKFGNPGNYPC